MYINQVCCSFASIKFVFKHVSYILIERMFGGKVFNNLSIAPCTAILIAAGCALLIVGLLLACGGTVLLCRVRRLKEKSMDTIEVQDNPLYGIHHRILTSTNVAYELTQVAHAET